MSRKNRLFTLLLLAALILSACQPVTRPAAPEPQPPHGIRFDAPEYAIDGPYAVGVRHFRVEPATASDRPLNVTVWYPALNPAGIVAETVYRMAVEPGQTPPWSVKGHALADAEPDVSAGPYPLVVYSHAHTSFSQEAAYLAEHLATRGFVVMASDHADNQFVPLGQRPWQTEYQRPDEVRRQIAFADTLTVAGGLLAGMIDAERVGVAGSSLGGGTALAAGGARLDLESFSALCESGIPAIKNYVLGADCVSVLENQAGLAELAGLDAIPQGLWPDWSDERVDAVVALLPTVAQFGEAGIQAVHVPTLLVSGLADFVVGETQRLYPPYDNLQVEHKAEVGFDNGGHMLFFPACRDVPELVALGLSGYCTDATWDMDRAHDLINHFATAFLLAELKGDAEAAAALAPENVAFPGIQYEAVGYAGVGALDAALSAEIDTMVTDMMARTRLPGFALAVAKDGELVYAKGFGTASLDGGEPVTPQTVFQWAETSMALTAMAVMQLAEEGKLDLDTPVTDYIPYFRLKDEGYKDITIRHLLAHTSGIPDSGDAMADWENFMPQYDAGATERWIREDLAETGLLFAPGTGFEYSDIAYALLGAVVGAASGQTYEDYMAEHIFAPLGMDNSTFLLEDVNKTLLARPHVTDAAGRLVPSAVQPYHRPFAGTNNLFSNIEDMAKLAQASLNGGELNGQRILPESTYDLMWEPYSPTPYAEFPFGRVHPAYMMLDWGFGWFLGEAAGQRVPSILGGEHGYNAEMALVPDANLAVIAVGNGQAIDEYYAPDMIADVLGTLLEK